MREVYPVIMPAIYKSVTQYRINLQQCIINIIIMNEPRIGWTKPLSVDYSKHPAPSNTAITITMGALTRICIDNQS